MLIDTCQLRRRIDLRSLKPRSIPLSRTICCRIFVKQCSIISADLKIADVLDMIAGDPFTLPRTAMTRETGHPISHSISENGNKAVVNYIEAAVLNYAGSNTILPI